LTGEKRQQALTTTFKHLVKDEIDTAGMPTTLGTQVFKDYRPPRDAFAIEKLRKAGAIILGKTTLSEYAAGDTYGWMFGVTRNPYDLERTVGGSSGGSAAALAANFMFRWRGGNTPPRQNVARPRRANPRPGQPMKASMCARSSERLSGQDEPSGYALKAEDIFW
jgi:hypothetical protein